MRWTEQEALAAGYAVDPHEAEAVLQRRQQKFCKDTGMLYYHVLDSRKSPRGWKDTIMIHPRGGCLFLIENKRTNGIITPEQREWHDALCNVTSIYPDFCRPADWPRLLQRLLAELGGLQ